MGDEDEKRQMKRMKQDDDRAHGQPKGRAYGLACRQSISTTFLLSSCNVTNRVI